jgi:hypothetical protein
MPFLYFFKKAGNGCAVSLHLLHRKGKLFIQKVPFLQTGNLRAAFHDKGWHYKSGMPALRGFENPKNNLFPMCIPCTFVSRLKIWD